MPTPSLLIVPARFKTGRLYSQIPTANGDFTVTRNTEARRFNSAGLIESVASGIPRLDYYTSGGVTGCPALLVEPAATNSILQSEAWNVSPWTATSGSQGATVSGNVTTSPDGTTNADKLIEAATTGTHFCLQSFTLTSGTTYTASFFVKASERTRGRLRMLGSGAYWDLDFNLTLGTATGATNTFIQNYGNGWYRIGGTFTANQASNNNFILSLLDASGNSSYTGNGTNGLFVWGAQIEVGSVATSYIPTTTGTGSRSADVISVTGAVSGSIGQTAGTAYLEIVAVSGINSGRVLSLTESSAPTNNRIAFSIDPSNFRLEIIVRSSGSITNGSIGSSAATLLTNGVNKIAYAYDGVAGNNALAINGSVVATNSQTLAFTQALSRVNVAILESDLTVATNQRIRAAALYTTRLTNSELAALTAP